MISDVRLACFNWGNTRYKESTVLSGDLWLCVIPILPHFASLSHIISYKMYIVILFRSTAKEYEDLFLFKCFLNRTTRYMKGVIVRIMIKEITCSYHENQNNIAFPCLFRNKATFMKHEERPNLLLFLLCAIIIPWRPRKRLVLKVVSLYNNDTIRDKILSWCCQLLFIWFIISKKSLPLSYFYFEVENGVMKTPYTIWLPYQVIWLAEYGKWRESCLLIGDANGQYGYVKSCALQGLPAFNSAQKRPVAALNTL